MTTLNDTFKKIESDSNERFPDVTNNYIERATVYISTLDTKKEGSGFLITSDGLIATCNHVVNDALEIKVSIEIRQKNGLFTTKDYNAKVVACDRTDDVALIRITNNTDNDKFNYYSLKTYREGFPLDRTNILMGCFPEGKSRFENITICEGKILSTNIDLADVSKNYWTYIDLSSAPGSSGSGIISKIDGCVEGIYAGCSVDKNNPSIRMHRMIPIQYLWKLLANYFEESIDINYKRAHATYRDNNCYNMQYHNNIIIKYGNITTFDGEAIVNAANKYLSRGTGGVCLAIFEKAGEKLDEECRKKGMQDIGNAVITSGFDDSPVKYIIHAVGPKYSDDESIEKLRITYRNCFEIAIQNGIKSIAFPSISTGTYRFPIDLASKIALKEIINYSNEFERIVIYCYDGETYRCYKNHFSILTDQYYKDC